MRLRTALNDALCVASAAELDTINVPILPQPVLEIREELQHVPILGFGFGSHRIGYPSDEVCSPYFSLHRPQGMMFAG
jgi:hypothetical protein